MKEQLYVANWKMNMPFEDAVAFVQEHTQALSALTSSEKKIVICPSFPALYTIHERLKDFDHLYVGAQGCSAHEHGAYTGEVSAVSLAQVGCTFCIVGHSERRSYWHETDEMVAQQLFCLLQNNIQPIICIGESKEQYEAGQTVKVLEKQLTPVLKTIADYFNTPSSFSDAWFGNGAPVTFCVAYEPVWAIGTGLVAQVDYVHQTLDWLTEFIKQTVNFDYSVQLLYGGSVDVKTVQPLKEIPTLNGFLIGGASLDFQKLKNIVS